LISDKLEDKVSKLGTRIPRGNLVLLRVGASEDGKTRGKSQIVDEKGALVPINFVYFHPDYDTFLKRERLTESLWKSFESVRNSLLQEDHRAYQKWKEARIKWEWSFLQEALLVDGPIWPAGMDSEKAAQVGKSEAFLDHEWDGYVRGKSAELTLDEGFQELTSMEQFKEAAKSEATLHQQLWMFNPVHIRRLAKHGNIIPADAAIAIPFLFSRCMIRRTPNDSVDGKKIRDAIPPKVVNFVVLRMNPKEQVDYCHIHQSQTRESPGFEQPFAANQQFYASFS
jgi:hypothetical protein